MKFINKNAYILVSFMKLILKKETRLAIVVVIEDEEVKEGRRWYQ